LQRAAAAQRPFSMLHRRLFGPQFTVGNGYSAPRSHTKPRARRRLFGPLFTIENWGLVTFSHTEPRARRRLFGPLFTIENRGLVTFSHTKPRAGAARAGPAAHGHRHLRGPRPGTRYLLLQNVTR
jgi:hypothetical protein